MVGVGETVCHLNPLSCRILHIYCYSLLIIVNYRRGGKDGTHKQRRRRMGGAAEGARTIVQSIIECSKPLGRECCIGDLVRLRDLCYAVER